MSEDGTAHQRSPTDALRVGVAIPAAGSGQRMGGVRKPFLELAGEPILLHALRPFLADQRVVAVCVALTEADAAEPPSWLSELDSRIQILAGGATRRASVERAIATLPDDVTTIAIHDAARPLVTADLVSRCIDGTEAGIGVVAGCPAIDTMKMVDADGLITHTPKRSKLWHAFTPQVFPAELVRRAYASGTEVGTEELTDDAALVERIGSVVRMIACGRENMKVTTPGDVFLAEALMNLRGPFQ